MNTDPQPPQLHIGRLRLQAPGLSREDGKVLAQHIQERMANLPAAGHSLHVGALSIRIPAEPGMSPEAMADAAVASLARSLNRSSHSPNA